MTRRRHLATLGAVALAACVAPTGEGEDVTIEIAELPVMIRGDTARVQAWLVGPSGERVEDASLRFGTADAAVAVATEDGLVTAVGPGTTAVLVWSPRIERGPTRTDLIVYGTVQIDSARPSQVRYGDALRLYGTGLDPSRGSAVQILDVPVPVLGYTAADSANPERFGMLEIVVPPPLSTLSRNGRNVDLTLTSGLGVASIKIDLAVEEVDRFEPNATAPADLGVLAGPREWLGLAIEALDFAALGLEPWDPLAYDIRRDASVDWYTFTTETEGDWTVSVVLSPTPRALVRLVLIPDAALEYQKDLAIWGDEIDTWQAPALSPSGLDVCGGAAAWWDETGVDAWFSPWISWPPYLTGAATPRFALERLPAGTHHLFVVGGGAFSELSGSDPNTWNIYLDGGFEDRKPIRYDLRIEPGIRTDAPPDPFEASGGDYCGTAPPLVTLTDQGFTDSVFTMTFDTPLDWDWLRVPSTMDGMLFVQVTGPPGSFVQATLTHPASGTATLPTWFGPLDLNAPRLVGGLLFGQSVDGTRELEHIASCGCFGAGGVVKAGENLLSVVDERGLVGTYTMRVSWAPGAVPGTPEGPPAQVAIERERQRRQPRWGGRR
jgi:hypothetical protein